MESVAYLRSNKEGFAEVRYSNTWIDNLIA